MSRERAAEIIAALMKRPRTCTELAIAIVVDPKRNCGPQELRKWVDEFRRSGVVYVAELRKRGGRAAKVYAMQPSLFELPDAGIASATQTEPAK